MITVIYYTANKYDTSKTLPALKKAIGDFPVISVSQKPLDFGKNICVGEIGASTRNLYTQVLIGAKEAKTKYVALAEDDVFYHYDHFHTQLPSEGKFLYNLNKWGFYTWTKPQIYSYKYNRKNLHQLICERELLIDLLENRFERFKEDLPIEFGEPGRYSKQLGEIAETETFMSVVPNIQITHEDCLSYALHGKKKAHGTLRVKELPFWGTVERGSKWPL